MVREPSTLSAKDLVKAFVYATDWLGVYVDEVNALNVYPVPDGDTGTNMHLTMQSVRRQLFDENPKTMAAFAHALSYGSLLGARGNSGVILSQILKGFAESVKEHSKLSAPHLVQALKSATKSAYAAVMKPVEGTILTVVRVAAEGAGKAGLEHALTSLERCTPGRRRSARANPRTAADAQTGRRGGLGRLGFFTGFGGRHRLVRR